MALILKTGDDLVSFTLPENFILHGLGNLNASNRFVKIPGISGEFKVGDGTLGKRVLTIKSEHLCTTKTLNITYVNGIIGWLELHRSWPSGLKLYYNSDRFVWVESWSLKHNFADFTDSLISQYDIEITLSDPLAYSDTEYAEDDDITGAESTPAALSIPTQQGYANSLPVIRITPANGVLASSIQLGFTSSDGVSMSYCLYSDLRMLGDASGHTWVELDSRNGTVSFTADNGATKQNSIQYFSGLFPVLLGQPVTMAMSYKGSDANILITYRKAYFV